MGILVFITCVPGTEEAFKEASLNNAKNSVQEAGIARFDCIQSITDPTKFVLVEVYKTGADGQAKHRETAHYLKWRDTVADMMAEPRTAVKYNTIFPESFKGWDVPQELSSGGAEDGKDNLLAVHVSVQCKPGTENDFIQASVENAKNSVREPGIARFDVLQNQEDATKFLLIEVYRSEAATLEHKETAHYKKWRDTVQDMMAQPRSALKYTSCFPFLDQNWKYPL